MPSPVHLAALLGSQFDPFRLPNTAGAYDYDDLSSLIYNGSNQILIAGDKSGNSTRNFFVNGNPGNAQIASLPTAYTIGTGQFTSSVRCLIPWNNPSSASVAALYLGPNSNGVTGANSLYWIINTTGQAQLAKRSGADALQAVVTVSGLVSSYGGDYHVLTVRRNETNWQLFVDGAAFGISSTSIFSETVDSTYLSVCPRNSITFDGSVQWARLYSTGLSDAEVLADARGTVQANNVVNCDFSSAPKMAPSFVCQSGQTFTVTGVGDAGARICGERDLYQATLGKCSVLSNVNGYYQAAQDGSNDFSKTGRFPLAQPLSIYWVGTMTSWTANDILLDGAANDTMEIFQDTSTPRISAYAGGTLGPFTQFTVGQKHVFGMVLNGANSFAAVDLNAIITGNAGTAIPNGITLGAQAAGANPSNIATNKLLIRSVADDAALFTRIMRALVRRNAVS